MPENPCIEILKNAYPELHKYLEDKAGIFDKSKKESWINAARDLQHETLDNLHNIYNKVGVKGFEKPIEKVVAAETALPIQEESKEPVPVAADTENIREKWAADNPDRINELADQATSEEHFKELIDKEIESSQIEKIKVNLPSDETTSTSTIEGAQEPLPEKGGTTARNRAQQTPQQKEKTLTQRLNNIDHEAITDEYDKVLAHFAGGGKIHPSAIKEIFGRAGKSTEGERRKHISMLGKNAPTIDGLAHSLWENIGMPDTPTTMDFKDAIERVVSSHNTWSTAARELVEKYDYDALYEKYGQTSDGQKTIEVAEQLTDNEINDILALDADKTKEQELDNYIDGIIDSGTLQEPQARYGKETNEQKHIRMQLEAAQQEYNAALVSFESKRRSLDKGLTADQEDLFGERKSKQAGSMFDERATQAAREKAIIPFKERLQKARIEVERLQKKYDETGSETSQTELRFEEPQAEYGKVISIDENKPATVEINGEQHPMPTKPSKGKQLTYTIGSSPGNYHEVRIYETPVANNRYNSGKIQHIETFNTFKEAAEYADKLKEANVKPLYEYQTQEQAISPRGGNVADAGRGQSVVSESSQEYGADSPYKKALQKVREKTSQGQVAAKSEENKPAEKPRIRVTAEELERAQPPKEEFEFTEGGEGTGIAHAATEEVRAKYGLGEYERNNATDAELEQAAEEAIAKGYNPEIVIAQMERGVPPSGIENFILKKYLATLQAQFEKNPTDTNLEKIHRLVRATDKIGSLQSEAFRTRRGLTPVEDSRAEFFITELATNNDAPLTETQKKVANEDFDRLSEARKKLDEDQKSLEQKVAAFKAEQELGKIKKKISSSSKKTHEAIVKEREEILKSIKEKWKNAGKDILSSDIPYRAQVFAIAPDVIKLARNLVEDGILKLEEIGKNIHGILKDDASDLTEKDIHDIIAGEYSEKNVTKKEVAIRLENLRQQAALVNKLERSESGRTKTDKQERKKNQEIATFKKQLGIDKLEQLIALKSRIHTQTGKLLEKLNKGDFRPEVKKVPLLEDMELKKRFPELFKQTQKSLDQYIKVKHEIALRRAKQLYEDKSTDEKIIEVLSKSLNVPRTLMASFDFSAPLRQGLVAFAGHPLIASKALKFMFEAAKDEKVYNRWLEEVHNSPHWKWAEKSGLGITDPESLHVIKAEEAFQGAQYAEKIPLLGGPIKLPLIKDGKVEWTEKKYGGFVKASERAYIGFLNKMRWDLFEMYANRFEDQGKTYENNKRLYEGISSLVNSETGRGGISKRLEKYSPIFNALLFSSKLMASRLNMLGLTDIPNLVIRGATFGKYGVDYGFYTRLPKELRIDAAIDMLKFLGVGISTLALIKGASYLTDDDVEIELDPRSSDFGKVRVGKQRWDIWGGFQPYARVLTQVITAQRKTTTTGHIQQLNGEGFMKQTRWTPLVSFFRSKAAPVPGSAINLFTGTDVIGQPVTVQGELLKSVTPLLFQDTYQAMKDQGVKAIFTVGVPAAFGIGVQTFNKPKK